MCSIIRAMTDNSPAVHVQPDGGAAWAPCYGSEVRLTGAGAIGCEGGESSSATYGRLLNRGARSGCRYAWRPGQPLRPTDTALSADFYAASPSLGRVGWRWCNRGGTGRRACRRPSRFHPSYRRSRTPEGPARLGCPAIQEDEPLRSVRALRRVRVRGRWGLRSRWRSRLGPARLRGGFRRVQRLRPRSCGCPGHVGEGAREC
jgi:hypothetical protein